MKLKKVWSSVIALCITITMIFNPLVFQTENAKAAETDKIIVYVAVEGKNAEGTVVKVKKTPVLLNEGSTASDAIKKVLDGSKYAKNYNISVTEYGDSLDSIGGLSMVQDGSNLYYWSFCVNGTYAPVGMSSYTLKDQDKISLIYTYHNSNLEASCFKDDVSLNPSEAKAAQILGTAIANRDILAAKIYESVFQNGEKVPGLGASSNLYYTIYSLKQAGFEAPEFYKAVYDKLEKDLKALEAGETITDPITNTSASLQSIMDSGYASPYFSKIVLAVSEMGYDATNIGGINLVEKIVNRQVYEASAPSAAYSTNGCECMILMALDSKNYTLPEGEKYLTRAELINTVLAGVNNNIENTIAWESLDGAAMSIQALAPYTAKIVEGVDSAKVQKVCNQVFGLLETMQASTGLFGDSYSENNPWTLAQVMNTAGKFKINILSEENADFIKNGVTLFDSASAFIDVATGAVDTKLMSYQPEQLLCGLSLTISAAKEAGITGKDIELPISEAVVKKITNQAYTGKKIKPVITVSHAGRTLTKDIDYKISYKNNKNCGTAKVIITGIGSYTGSKTVSFKIVLGESKNISIKGKKVTFSKVTGAKKYKVQIAESKNFKKNLVTKTLVKNSFVYSGFKKGKTYYIRVKALNGKNTSKYSLTKVIKK